jgi:hypothetical protein
MNQNRLIKIGWFLSFGSFAVYHHHRVEQLKKGIAEAHRLSTELLDERLDWIHKQQEREINPSKDV